MINELRLLEENEHLPHINTIVQDKKIELEEIRHDQMKGNIVRSRINGIREGEKPTKYFCCLESQNYIDKTIKKSSTTEWGL